jgi:hypothetical protein
MAHLQSLRAQTPILFDLFTLQVREAADARVPDSVGSTVTTMASYGHNELSRASLGAILNGGQPEA